MEKPRKGSGSKNTQIKGRRVFQGERHQTETPGKTTTGTRKSLKLGEDLGSEELPGSTSSRSVILIWRHSELSRLCGTGTFGE